MFTGFTNQTFEFFMAIRFNNNRAFFQENHDWYWEHVRLPALALSVSRSPTVEAIDPLLERRPNRVVSRINRDIRFTKDKSPYRDHLFLAFRRPGTDRQSTPGLYFEITDQEAYCGMGFYGENRPRMNALRADLLRNPQEFSQIVQALEPDFSAHINAFKRMKIPDGLPASLRPWYLAKGFYMEKTWTDFSLFKSPALAEEIARSFQRLRALYAYVIELEPMEDN